MILFTILWEKWPYCKYHVFSTILKKIKTRSLKQKIIWSIINFKIRSHHKLNSLSVAAVLITMSKSYYFKLVLKRFAHSDLILTYPKCVLLTSHHTSATVFCTFHSYRDIINVYHAYLTSTKEINILAIWKRKNIINYHFCYLKKLSYPPNSSVLLFLLCFFFLRQ